MIWGDDSETGDHIVPFKVTSEQLNRKDHIRSDGSNKAVKPAEQTDLHDSKLGRSSSGSWPDSSLSNARKADPGSSSATELSKRLAEPARYSSNKGGAFSSNSAVLLGYVLFKSKKTSELWKGPDIFHSTDATDESQEQGGFDEYGWANIGSFDDLDRMFSNDVPIFGGADELWSSSKDVFNSPSKSLPSVLDSQQENQQFQQTKMMKFSRCDTFQDFPGKFVNQFAPSRSSLMAINLQSEFQGSGTSHYPHMPNQYMATSGFGNHTNPYSSSFQRPDVKNQLMHPSYNPATAISINMVTDASAKPSTMAQQQMQAMLAVQRQQQQFRHQVPLADQYITLNCCQDNPLQLVDKANLQGLTAMPSFDPSSSLEPGDSAAVDNSSEFSVLYRLQDVVAKLDMGTRTCIRDSLFRLADSAGHRHHSSDTAHSNRTSQDYQEVIPKEKSRYRYGGMLDTETVTNPTDRTVAHLLFHRPFDILAAKHMEGPESPASSKIGLEENGTFPKCSTRESHINKQKAKEEHQSAGSLTFGNAPNSGTSC
ncbi:hypothetical protein Bca52824_077288 [Brassica carinata]|uniref:Uncharacterized protein n=1 Tax=Brassica carinata TaxID=52824 RepID=A0A8X7PYM9_BRACI|nr:hypothetical protein Bca52824_077288 [Brassica carinata]